MAGNPGGLGPLLFLYPALKLLEFSFSLPFKGRGGDGVSCGMKGQTNERILKPRLQRRLRKNPTDAEQRVWNNDVLRDIEAVKEAIWLVLQERSTPSPSQPSP